MLLISFYGYKTFLKANIRKIPYTCIRMNKNFLAVLANHIMSEKIEKKPIDLYIVNQVRDIRNDKKISQEIIAFHLGVSEGFIGQIESPKFRAKYNIDHLNSLAKLFKCSPKDFLPEEPL